MQPTLEIHPHQEFHFAPETDSSGCCCFWRSKSSKKQEYIVDKDNRLKPTTHANMHQRIQANQRLGQMIQKKFEEDPIENNRAFEMLKMRVNESFNENDPITDERLARIINEIHKMKSELNLKEHNG